MADDGVALASIKATRPGRDGHFVHRVEDAFTSLAHVAGIDGGVDLNIMRAN